MERPDNAVTSLKAVLAVALSLALVFMLVPAALPAQANAADTSDDVVWSYDDEDDDDEWSDDEWDDDDDGWPYDTADWPDMDSAYLDPSSIEAYVLDDDGYYYDYVEKQITIKGVENFPEDTAEDFAYTSSNDDIDVYCSQEGTAIQLWADGIGSTTITFMVYGKTLTLDLTIHVVSFSGSNSFLLVKGKTKQLKLKGAGGKATWKSSNAAALSVSASGKIKAKKEGNALVTATIGTCKVGCVVSVVSKKRKAVVNTAIKIGKTCKYSQAKRMQAGYYDCSSLVWKAYRKMGISFGDSSYAPTAANNAKWCATHGKIIKGSVKKNVQKMKYLPGALRYGTGASNGEYKGIYHVEMFVGYTFEGFDSNGKAVLGVKYANRYDNYYGYTGLWSQP